MSVQQLLSMSVAVDDPNDAYQEYRYNGKLFRICDSQPITLPDGATISLDSMNVKIADFGHGSHQRLTVLIVSMSN